MNKKYLLDTCTISCFFRGNQFVLKQMQSKTPEQLCMSAITVHEIEYGLTIKNSKAAELETKWSDMKRLLNIIDFNKNAAIKAAIIRSSLKREESPIGVYELLVGSTCVAEDLICVTSNLSEFSKIKELKTEDWSN